MFSEYENYLARLPLSPHTKRSYRTHVRQFFQWLEGYDDYQKALESQSERDFAIREFKQFLLQRGARASTINGTLAALDNFYLFRGLGPCTIKRLQVGKLAPRALEPDEQRRFNRVVSLSKSLRNKAIATVMLNCGLRLNEVAQLNVGDVVLTARKRELTVRCGKGMKRRVLPLNKEAAEILQQFLGPGISSPPETPLFISQKGNRLSTAAIDHAIRALGKEAGVALSSHILRHSFITRLIRANQDIVVVAELAGHTVQMTQRYSLPTQAVMLRAVETLSSDNAAPTP